MKTFFQFHNKNEILLDLLTFLISVSQELEATRQNMNCE